MVQQKQAFTLIELLVVVLIIGILSAVALPQYQKAVLKSRYTRLKPLVFALAAAQEVYYLAHGEYAGSISELDIDFSEVSQDVVLNSVSGNDYKFVWGVCSCGGKFPLARMVCSNTDIGMSYGKILQHPSQSYSSYAGKQRCNADTDNIAGSKICQQESGLEEPVLPGPGQVRAYYW